jgi:hypothetical protein
MSSTQAMTLDASGKLGVGVTSPVMSVQAASGIAVSSDSTLTQVSRIYESFGLQIDSGEAAGNTRPIVFRTGGTERARIDTSGNLLVGISSYATTPAAGVTVQTGDNASVNIGHTNSSTGFLFVNFGYNSGQIGSITQSGTTAVLYNTTSDQRLKENIQDADSASSLIDSLQVRQFDWKSDNSHQRYGFVAQELVTVAPEAVHQPADPEEMMAVDYSKLVPMLVKEIQSLRQRLAAANI